MNTERPEFCTEDHLVTLDWIRESGICNMLGAAQPLMEEHEELDIKEARKVLSYWIDTHEERQANA